MISLKIDLIFQLLDEGLLDQVAQLDPASSAKCDQRIFYSLVYYC